MSIGECIELCRRHGIPYRFFRGKLQVPHVYCSPRTDRFSGWARRWIAAPAKRIELLHWLGY